MDPSQLTIELKPAYSILKPAFNLLPAQQQQHARLLPAHIKPLSTQQLSGQHVMQHSATSVSESQQFTALPLLARQPNNNQKPLILANQQTLYLQQQHQILLQKQPAQQHRQQETQQRQPNVNSSNNRDNNSNQQQDDNKQTQNKQQQQQQEPQNLSICKKNKAVKKPQLDNKLLDSAQVDNTLLDGLCIEVVCGSNSAVMDLSRLRSGSKIACVRFGNHWLTPNQFQHVSGRGTARDWKRSIKHNGTSLKALLSNKTLSFDIPACVCSLCSSQPTTECDIVEDLSLKTGAQLNNCSPTTTTASVAVTQGPVTSGTVTQGLITQGLVMDGFGLPTALPFTLGPVTQGPATTSPVRDESTLTAASLAALLNCQQYLKQQQMKSADISRSMVDALSLDSNNNTSQSDDESDDEDDSILGMEEASITAELMGRQQQHETDDDEIISATVCTDIDGTLDREEIERKRELMKSLGLIQINQSLQTSSSTSAIPSTDYSECNESVNKTVKTCAKINTCNNSPTVNHFINTIDNKSFKSFVITSVNSTVNLFTNAVVNTFANQIGNSAVKAFNNTSVNSIVNPFTNKSSNSVVSPFTNAPVSATVNLLTNTSVNSTINPATNTCMCLCTDSNKRASMLDDFNSIPVKKKRKKAVRDTHITASDLAALARRVDSGIEPRFVRPEAAPLTPEMSSSTYTMKTTTPVMSSSDLAMKARPDISAVLTAAVQAAAGSQTSAEAVSKEQQLQNGSGLLYWKEKELEMTHIIHELRNYKKHLEQSIGADRGQQQQHSSIPVSTATDSVSEVHDGAISVGSSLMAPSVDENDVKSCFSLLSNNAATVTDSESAEGSKQILDTVCSSGRCRATTTTSSLTTMQRSCAGSVVPTPISTTRHPSPQPIPLHRSSVDSRQARGKPKPGGGGLPDLVPSSPSATRPLTTGTSAMNGPQDLGMGPIASVPIGYMYGSLPTPGADVTAAMSGLSPVYSLCLSPLVYSPLFSHTATLRSKLCSATATEMTMAATVTDDKFSTDVVSDCGFTSPAPTLGSRLQQFTTTGLYSPYPQPLATTTTDVLMATMPYSTKPYISTAPFSWIPHRWNTVPYGMITEEELPRWDRHGALNLTARPTKRPQEPTTKRPLETAPNRPLETTRGPAFKRNLFSAEPVSSAGKYRVVLTSTSDEEMDVKLSLHCTNKGEVIDLSCKSGGEYDQLYLHSNTELLDLSLSKSEQLSNSCHNNGGEQHSNSCHSNNREQFSNLFDGNNKFSNNADMQVDYSNSCHGYHIENNSIYEESSRNSSQFNVLSNGNQGNECSHGDGCHEHCNSEKKLNVKDKHSNQSGVSQDLPNSSEHSEILTDNCGVTIVENWKSDCVENNEIKEEIDDKDDDDVDKFSFSHKNSRGPSDENLDRPSPYSQHTVLSCEPIGASNNNNNSITSAAVCDFGQRLCADKNGQSINQSMSMIRMFNQSIQVHDKTDVSGDVELSCARDIGSLSDVAARSTEAALTPTSDTYQSQA